MCLSIKKNILKSRMVMKTRKKYKLLHNLTQKVYLTEAYKLMLPEPYLSFETGPVFTAY